MRRSFQGFLIAIAAAAMFFAAAAFNAASTGTRTVTASVVGDSAAYLAINANGSSPHAGFVTTSGGKISIAFGSGVATGTGVNPDSTYYFDHILNITNQGTAPVTVQVNTTATTGAVKVCLKAVAVAMDNSCYSTATTAQTLAVGAKLGLGIMVQATSLSTGATVSGTISIDANR